MCLMPFSGWYYNLFGLDKLDKSNFLTIQSEEVTLRSFKAREKPLKQTLMLARSRS